MKHYILPTLAVLLGLSACSTDIDTTDAGAAKVPVTVNATIGSPFTRSTPLGDNAAQASFNQGDEISISNGEESKTYRLTGSSWTTDGEAIGAYPLVSTTFEAYYPIKDGNSYESGTVETDQNMTGLEKSDFMTASTPLNPTKNNTLNLSFQRKTAKVTVNVVGYRDEVPVANRNISTLSMYANVNVGDNAETNEGIIIMKKLSDDKFVALVGTSSESSEGFLSFSFANRERKLFTNYRPKLEAGKAYTFNVTVGRDVLTVENVTVTEFTDDESDGGTALMNLPLMLNNEIGDEKGKTFTLTGTWDNKYFEDIRNFTSSHSDADLTVDLSQVTGLTSIPDNAFYNSNIGCQGLTGIILPSTVTSIGKNAFSKTGLKSINLPEGITYIGELAFKSTDIETLELPSSYTDVKYNALAYISSNLKEIRFKGNVTNLGSRGFYGNSGLKSIYSNKCWRVPTIYSSSLSLKNKGIQNVTVYVSSEDMKKKFESDRLWKKAMMEKGYTFAVAP